MQDKVGSFIANSQGQSLMNHSLAVANLASAMAEYAGVSNENYILDKVYTSALLHDVGKSIKYIQKHLVSVYDACNSFIISDDINDNFSIEKPLHNEVGWAYLSRKIEDRHILNAVYWHHAQRTNNKVNYDNVDKIFSCLGEEMNEIDNFWNELSKYIPNSIRRGYIDEEIEVADLFKKDDECRRLNNAEFMFIRGCVISSDRHISSLDKNIENFVNDINYCKSVVEDMSKANIKGEITIPKEYELERFLEQKSVVESVGDNKSVIVKAPAGYGKTMIGLLWAKKRNKKIIWICPRNAVVRSVYDSILKEINILKIECSVEMYVTGERKETNVKDDRKEFDSDIIVTNIDAILSPMVNNRVAGRLFTVYGCDIVLDEFHECVSDAPIFAAFITYMRIRHCLLNNVRTLLLSATPSYLNFLWELNGVKTLFLPNENEHYKPQHDFDYKINFIDKFPTKAEKGSLLVCNSVKNSQDNYYKDYNYIIHHNFTDKDRELKENEIKKAFSKNGNGVVNGESVSAALVVQAAMDISFRELFDSICSPDSTGQRIGRINRWGTLQQYIPTINFLNSIDNKSEKRTVDMIYDIDLRNKWLDFLKSELQGKEFMNLEFFYKIYNKFYIIYREDYKKFVKEKYKNGLEELIDFKPKKYINIEKKEVKSFGKSLRSPNGSYYYTVEIEGEPNNWVTFEEVLSEGSELKRRSKNNPAFIQGLCFNPSKMKTCLRGIVDSGYSAWNRYAKGKVNLPRTLDDWFKKARSPETPLPDFSRKYNKEVGVRKNLDL